MSISNSAYIIYGFKIPDDDEFEKIHGCNPDAYIKENKLKYVKIHCAGCDDYIVNFMGFIVNELDDFTRSKPYTTVKHELIRNMSDKRFQFVDAAALPMNLKADFYMIGTSF